MSAKTGKQNHYYLPPVAFEKMPLSVEDFLPVNINILIGLEDTIHPDKLLSALQNSLAIFPHLTGRLEVEIDQGIFAVKPSSHNVSVEFNSGINLAPENLPYLKREMLSQLFLPSSAHKTFNLQNPDQLPLFELRISKLNQCGTVLGITVAHAIVDGSGLKLFVDTFNACLHGKPLPELIHDRRQTFQNTHVYECELPQHYSELPSLKSFLRNTYRDLDTTVLLVLSISKKMLEELFNVKNETDARFMLTALLSQSIATFINEDVTIGLWCNTRGIAVAKNYTGNAGCYVHIDCPQNNTLQENFTRLKKVLTSRGMVQIRRNYQRIKAAEAHSKYVFWKGPRRNLVAVNLVPQISNISLFDANCPSYVQILTRNVSGIRIYSSEESHTVEICFDSELCTHLMKQIIDLGLKPEILNSESF